AAISCFAGNHRNASLKRVRLLRRGRRYGPESGGMTIDAGNDIWTTRRDSFTAAESQGGFGL
ncbi:MAG: hypothetical protein ACXW3F_18290, partial [Pyrinomonadaceae bacterium]